MAEIRHLCFGAMETTAAEMVNRGLPRKGQLNKELKDKKESNMQTLGEESPQGKEVSAGVLSAG